MAKKKSTSGKKKNRSPRSVLELSGEKVREFFLAPSNYCSIDLPKYFTFEKLLKNVSTVLSNSEIGNFYETDKRPDLYEGVNHSLYNNKDGKFAWRPLQIIHPAIYVSLINKMTKTENWKAITDRFKEFTANTKIQCLSIPQIYSTNRPNTAEQILNWWSQVEQASIALSIEYDYTIHTDIVDCYGAIYTHSIAWALHTKEVAKKPENRNKQTLIGNVIDRHIQWMRYGQTNGIPQGSVLMDFISEMVLGYADLEITKELESSEVTDYRILRYRDDYRIFTNNSQHGEILLKVITEVLIGLGLKLGSGKTKASNSVVLSSIKADKIAWIQSKQSEKNLQKHLILIHQHSVSHPNSGSLVGALTEFYKRIEPLKPKEFLNPISIIGILVDIAFHNPRIYPQFAAILSKLLSLLEDNEAAEVVEKVRTKFKKLPNIGHMQLWLQRISHPIIEDVGYSEPLCRLVMGESPVIWNRDWIKPGKLRDAVDKSEIVDRKKLERLARIVTVREVDLFFRFDSGY
jgi:RNA-directed DNA polymerase